MYCVNMLTWTSKLATDHTLVSFSYDWTPCIQRYKDTQLYKHETNDTNVGDGEKINCNLK